jgi:hypothetical protein
MTQPIGRLLSCDLGFMPQAELGLLFDGAHSVHSFSSILRRRSIDNVDNIGQIPYCLLPLFWH